MSTAVVAVEIPTEASVRHLLDESDRFALERYGPDEAFLLPLEALTATGVHVFVARVDEAAVGMVALVTNQAAEWAEVKRLVVAETARGLGVAGALMDAVHAFARAAGIREIKLETGPLNHAALRLYLRYGYEETGPFADYEPIEASRFYRLALD